MALGQFEGTGHDKVWGPGLGLAIGIEFRFRHDHRRRLDKYQQRQFPVGVTRNPERLAVESLEFHHRQRNIRWRATKIDDVAARAGIAIVDVVRLQQGVSVETVAQERCERPERGIAVVSGRRELVAVKFVQVPGLGIHGEDRRRGTG